MVPFNLPPGFDLVLADIDAGSHTPTLVSKVLNWKKTKPEEGIFKEKRERKKNIKRLLASLLWTELNECNSKVEARFRNLIRLSEQSPEEYKSTIELCSSRHFYQWSSAEGQVAVELLDLHDEFDRVRSLLRKMGELSDVPIEPKEQTQLLEACMQVPGVVMAGVPGGKSINGWFVL